MQRLAGTAEKSASTPPPLSPRPLTHPYRVRERSSGVDTPVLRGVAGLSQLLVSSHDHSERTGCVTGLETPCLRRAGALVRCGVRGRTGRTPVC